ncbi:cytochrome d ubiquinol oxidase subunit II [Lactovum miscens]|uniref:Cytochrome d ubiquinol oxidase subunit II n=1 Tax=Lactovum miscens TaxID=190387 RepID=A0A841C846_9LACT|nr:cytochrome d ubiquinol oxidase subunit II [Lactovum miscens]MBB5887898.1 cytochrome d ubiquinol oxidase subunit II [Lactovum miscens]
MSTLQLLWFILIAILFSGFFFFEGFDFGVGISTLFVAKDEHEVDQAISAIGPVWDGNEVWLLTAGGAMFASFPFWYASLFSGFYNLFLLILVGLICRGVSFEFRHRALSKKGHDFWQKVLGISSLFIPFLFGMVFTAFIQGMPMDAHGNVTGGFFDYVNLLSIVGGVAVALLSWLHGLNYLSLKVEGPLRERSHRFANKLYFILYVGEVVFAVLLVIFTDFFQKHVLWSSILIVVIVALSVIGHLSSINNKEMTAFISSGLTFIALVALIFQGIFPRVMVADNPANSILIKNASSTVYTLTTMSFVALFILPFVLIYIGWTYYVFRKRIQK